MKRQYLPTILYGIMALICFSAAVMRAQDNAIDLTHLPLGDGLDSTEPRAGYLWACRVDSGGGGAFQDGPWINGDGTWNRLIKIFVDGAVEWPDHEFTVQAAGDERLMLGNGLPDHPTGIYPIQTSDDAYQYDRNPNQISAQSLSFGLPLQPTVAVSPSCAGGVVGIMLDGVPIFNGFDAEGRDAVAHEVQDSCGGHPERTGQYHYHDLSACIEERTEGTTHSELVGYMFDGFGLYGFRGENGELLTNADLDECHGHTHEIEWDGVRVTMYHYHATAEFPYTIGCYRGTPVQSAFSGGQPPTSGGDQSPPQGGNQPPPPNGGNQPPPPPQGGGNQPPPPGGGQQPPPPGG